jgi:carbamoyl-phosphate synthase large subunit
VLTVDERRTAIGASRPLRVAALASATPYCTTIAAAEAVADAVHHAGDFGIRPLHALHDDLPAVTPASDGRPVPERADLAAAATVVPERRRGSRERTVGVPALKVFIRQPFTESDENQRQMIDAIMQIIDSANGVPYPFQYLTGLEAESAATFKKNFERKHHLPFTPQNFRDHRLALLDAADVMVNIRVGMSESSAFELAYHIFKGRRTPLLFLVWKGAPIKTTLIRELDDLLDVTYLEFDHVDELRAGVHQFFQSRRLGQTLRAAA